MHNFSLRRCLFFVLFCTMLGLGITLVVSNRAAHSTTGALRGIPDGDADRVLGQNNFITNEPVLSASGLGNPSGVAIGSDGRLFVVDYAHNRVVSWPGAADFTNGQVADLVIGQNDFTSTVGQTTQSGLNAPESVAVSPRDGYLWVADSYNQRLLGYAPPFSTGMNAAIVLGQADFTRGQPNRGQPAPDPRSLWFPRGMAFDANGNLFVADQFNHRVLRYSFPLSSGMGADLVIGQANFVSGMANRDNGGVKRNSFWAPVAVVVDSAGNLYVADRDNNRVLRFDAPQGHGMDASAVIGKPGFTEAPALYQDCQDNPFSDASPVINAASLTEPIDLALNAVGDLFVSDFCFHRVLLYQQPLTTDLTADGVYGQADFTSGNANRGNSQPGRNALYGPHGLAVSSTGALYMADLFNNRILAFDVAGSSPTPTATETTIGTPPTATPTTPAPTATATATLGTPAPGGGDSFENDDACNVASVASTTGAPQSHTFHTAGDVDWVKFSASANKSYAIRVENGKADTVLEIFDACDLPPSGSGNNSFGSEVLVELDSTKNGDYWIKLTQFDGSGGVDIDYKVSVKEDQTPPSEPENVRCVAVDAATLGVQWQKAPERDVKRYIVQYVGAQSGNVNVNEAGATFAAIPNLTPGQTYEVTVRAFDYANNASNATLPLPCKLQAAPDSTIPAITLESPGATSVISTSSNLLTFNGKVSDLGNNLSRVEVRNTTTGVSKWDYSLTGANAIFRAENLAIQAGDNLIEINAFDAAGNVGKRTLTVKRLSGSTGAAIIIAGRNETNALQPNIYHAANRAYRIFLSAGYSKEAIFYIAPTQQDADNDGVADDVDSQPGAPAAIQTALLTWAADKVGPGKPLFVYMIDHGFVDKFCVAGCSNANAITPGDLAGWLSALETASGVDQVNVIIEACLSGSFITRAGGADPHSLSKLGRVIITSTSDNKNAYASATGAYFSDAFFSCAADSNNLKACFDQANEAVAATGVQQFPQLDDNGDGVYNSNADGAIAQGRLLTRFFAATRPAILSASVERTGANGLLTAMVQEGAEAIDVVWAAIYPPNFSEPSDPTNNPTLNLNVPTVRLLPVANTPGQYREAYPNGFVETGDYRIIFYAQDKQGIHALPRLPGGGVYLPLMLR